MGIIPPRKNAPRLPTTAEKETLQTPARRSHRLPQTPITTNSVAGKATAMLGQISSSNQVRASRLGSCTSEPRKKTARQSAQKLCSRSLNQQAWEDKLMILRKTMQGREYRSVTARLQRPWQIWS